MQIFGFQIGRTKAAVPAMSFANTNGAFGGGWFGVVREPYAGAFQSGVTVDAPKNLLSNSSVFASVTLMASDIAKLGIGLVDEDAKGITTPVPANSPYWPVLRRPNHFQNRIKFLEHWMLSKLLAGNMYALKERDNRGLVTALYILNPLLVTPLVTPSGDVYYKLEADHLSGVSISITVPASEIIHDRMNCLFHPLVGVSPLYAAGMSATMSNKILSNSATFFANMSRPGGMLTAPGTIEDATATRLKSEFEQNFAGHQMGRLFVGGDGLQFTPMSVAAEAAQLVEQLDWTAIDVARAFHMPLFKIGAESGRNVGALSIESQQQLYLNDCLHIHIEDIELCLTEGLSLPGGYEVEIDEEGMLRMDKSALYSALGEGVKSTVLAPNEARKKLGLKPVPAAIHRWRSNRISASWRSRSAMRSPTHSQPRRCRLHPHRRRRLHQRPPPRRRRRNQAPNSRSNSWPVSARLASA
jgi:HK97 family phage portal protein